MFSVNEQKTRTGTLGEKIVAKYFRDLGHKVDESLDLFDEKKDMMIDEDYCQVKTQQKWHKEKAFTVSHAQVSKCRSVDRLIFVDTPSKYDKPVVRIYEYPKDKRNFYKKETSDGRYMYLLKVSDGNLLTTIEDSVIIDQFNKYSTSTWR